MTIVKKILIMSAHFFLLGWIVFALYFLGTASMKEVIFHFIGIGFYGAFLIRFCAYDGKKELEREKLQNISPSSVDKNSPPI